MISKDSKRSKKISSRKHNGSAFSDSDNLRDSKMIAANKFELNLSLKHQSYSEEKIDLELKNFFEAKVMIQELDQTVKQKEDLASFLGEPLFSKLTNTNGYELTIDQIIEREEHNKKVALIRSQLQLMKEFDKLIANNHAMIDSLLQEIQVLQADNKHLAKEINVIYENKLLEIQNQNKVKMSFLCNIFAQLQQTLSQKPLQEPQQPSQVPQSQFNISEYPEPMKLHESLEKPLGFREEPEEQKAHHFQDFDEQQGLQLEGQAQGQVGMNIQKAQQYEEKQDSGLYLDLDRPEFLNLDLDRIFDEL